jgi:hypothetical protein
LLAAAAAARPEDAGEREGTVSGGTRPRPARPAGPHLTVLGLKFPHAAAGAGVPRPPAGRALRCRSEVRGGTSAGAAWIGCRTELGSGSREPGRGGRGSARRQGTAAPAAARLLLSARARARALTAATAAPPAAAARNARAAPALPGVHQHHWGGGGPRPTARRPATRACSCLRGRSEAASGPRGSGSLRSPVGTPVLPRPFWAWDPQARGPLLLKGGPCGCPGPGASSCTPWLVGVCVGIRGGEDRSPIGRTWRGGQGPILAWGVHLLPSS